MNGNGAESSTQRERRRLSLPRRVWAAYTELAEAAIADESVNPPAFLPRPTRIAWARHRVMAARA